MKIESPSEEITIDVNLPGHFEALSAQADNVPDKVSPGATILSECSREFTHSCKALCAHKVPGPEFVDESYVREAKLKPLDLVNECTPWTTYLVRSISIKHRDHEGELPERQHSYLTSTRIGSAFSGDMHLDQLAKNRDTLVENLLSDAQVIRSMVERDCVGLDSPRPMSDGLLHEFKPKDKVYDCLDILQQWVFRHHECSHLRLNMLRHLREMQASEGSQPLQKAFSCTCSPAGYQMLLCNERTATAPNKEDMSKVSIGCQGQELIMSIRLSSLTGVISSGLPGYVKALGGQAVGANLVFESACLSVCVLIYLEGEDWIERFECQDYLGIQLYSCPCILKLRVPGQSQENHPRWMLITDPAKTTVYFENPSKSEVWRAFNIREYLTTDPISGGCTMSPSCETSDESPVQVWLRKIAVNKVHELLRVEIAELQWLDSRDHGPGKIRDVLESIFRHKVQNAASMASEESTVDSVWLVTSAKAHFQMPKKEGQEYHRLPDTAVAHIHTRVSTSQVRSCLNSNGSRQAAGMISNKIDSKPYLLLLVHHWCPALLSTSPHHVYSAKPRKFHVCVNGLKDQGVYLRFGACPFRKVDRKAISIACSRSCKILNKVACIKGCERANFLAVPAADRKTCLCKRWTESFCPEDIDAHLEFEFTALVPSCILPPCFPRQVCGRQECSELQECDHLFCITEQLVQIQSTWRQSQYVYAEPFLCFGRENNADWISQSEMMSQEGSAGSRNPRLFSFCSVFESPHKPRSAPSLFKHVEAVIEWASQESQNKHHLPSFFDVNLSLLGFKQGDQALCYSDRVQPNSGVKSCKDCKTENLNGERKEVGTRPCCVLHLFCKVGVQCTSSLPVFPPPVFCPTHACSVQSNSPSTFKFNDLRKSCYGMSASALRFQARSEVLQWLSRDRQSRNDLRRPKGKGSGESKIRLRFVSRSVKEVSTSKCLGFPSSSSYLYAYPSLQTVGPSSSVQMDLVWKCWKRKRDTESQGSRSNVSSHVMLPQGPEFEFVKRLLQCVEGHSRPRLMDRTRSSEQSTIQWLVSQFILREVGDSLCDSTVIRLDGSNCSICPRTPRSAWSALSDDNWTSQVRQQDRAGYRDQD